MSRSTVHIAILSSAALVGLMVSYSTPALAQIKSADDGAGTAESTQVEAPEGVTDIIVTAQKREQRLQDVPVAVTALSSAMLVANRIMSVRDLSGVVPSLTVRNQVGGSSLPVYTMRGLVATGSATGSDKGIATYIDGVFLGAATGSIFELAEIERVEVLRGPQGTLFGRNSTGGAISFVTPEPSGKFGVKQIVTVGNYDQFRSVTRVNTPEFGGLSASMSYVHSERRGDIRNSGGGTRWDLTQANNGRAKFVTASNWLGSNNIDAIGVQVKWEPNSDLKFVYRFDLTDNDYTANGLGTLYLSPALRLAVAAQPTGNLVAPISASRPKAVNNGFLADSHTRNWGHSLTGEARLSDTISVKNILAYRKLKFSAPLTDVSSVGGLINTGAPIFAGLLGPTVAGATIGAPLAVIVSSTRGSDEQWSNEFQLNVDTDLVTLTTGALYYRQKPGKGGCCAEDGLGEIRGGSLRVFPGNALPYLGQPAGYEARYTSITIESLAAYAYGEFHVAPQFDLVGGIRFTRDKKDGIDNAGYSAATPFSFDLHYKDSRFTYNLGANYKITSDILLYGKYSTGFISGGSLAGIVYGAETAKSWEAGIKADWLGRMLRTNLAVYSVDYGDLQFSTSGLALSPPRPDISQALVNAGDARARGFELETTFVPTRGLTFESGVGYTDFKYKTLLPLVTAGASEFLKQYRPKWTLNLAGTYETEPLFDDVTLTARLDANYRSASQSIGSIPSNLSAVEKELYRESGRIRSYWITNGRVAFDGIDIGGTKASIAFWARNLLNTKAPSYAISFVLSVAADYERARTFGADLTLKF